MKSDTTFLGTVLISLCIIAGGIIIGAEIFDIGIPFAPYVMVVLAVLVVIGAAALLLSCRRLESGTAQK